MANLEDLFVDGGRAGALMRAHDWSQSPLGHPSTGRSRCAPSSGCCCSRGSRCSSPGARSSASSTTTPTPRSSAPSIPRALGRRFHDIWSEIWPDISPLIDAAMAGQATYREDLPLVMNRKGYDEQTWFTFSYSPVRDESGGVAGMFCACSETTQRVLAERALRESEARLRELNETLERRVAEALAERKLLADIVEATRRLRPGGRPRYRWLAINSAAADEFERIFGVRPKVGDSMLDLLADQPEHQAAVKRSGAGRSPARSSPRSTSSAIRRATAAPTRCGSTRCAIASGTPDRRLPVRLRRHRAAARPGAAARRRGGAAPGAEDGIARPADRRRRARLQQPARGVRQRPAAARTHRPARRAPRMLEAMRRAVARGTGLTRQLLAFSRRRPVNPESIDVGAHLAGMRAMLDALAGRRHRGRDEFGGRRLAGRSRSRRDGARDPEPVRQRARRDAGRRRRSRSPRTTSASRRRRRRRVRQDLGRRTPASACRRRCWRGRSSRSSPPRTSARDRGSACRRSTASPSSPAAGSRSTARSASARP